MRWIKVFFAWFIIATLAGGVVDIFFVIFKVPGIYNGLIGLAGIVIATLVVRRLLNKGVFGK